MDFRQLRYLVSIAEHGNVTRAAESLFISQSALSHYLLKAEEELGIKIFDRTTTPLTLTQAGECYIRTAREILIADDQLSKELRDITHHMTGKLKIGTSRDRASYLIPRLVGEFGKKYPGIEVEVVTDSSQKLRERLRSGQVDMMLLPSNREDDDRGIESETLYQEEMLFAVKAGSLSPDMYRDAHTVSRKALREMPFFTMFQDHASRTFCERFLRAQRIRPNIKMEFSSNIICYNMAAEGLGYAIVPYMIPRFVLPPHEVELLSLDDPPVLWDVKMFYRKDAYLGEPEKEMIRIAKKLFPAERLKR